MIFSKKKKSLCGAMTPRRIGWFLSLQDVLLTTTVHIAPEGLTPICHAFSNKFSPFCTDGNLLYLFFSVKKTLFFNFFFYFLKISIFVQMRALRSVSILLKRLFFRLLFPTRMFTTRMSFSKGYVSFANFIAGQFLWFTDSQQVGSCARSFVGLL